MSAGLRNALIVLAIAGAVYAVPGGSPAAGFVGSLLTTLMLFALAFVAWRTYRERRVDLYSLGDTHRAMLYGALAAGLVAAAGYQRLLQDGSSIQKFAWFVIVGGASYALFAVYRQWREHA